MSEPFFKRIADRLRTGSIRTRLMLWNMVAMAVLLGAFGILIRYTTNTLLMSSVDHDLEVRTHRMTERRPPRPQPAGNGPDAAAFPADQIPPQAGDAGAQLAPQAGGDPQGQEPPDMGGPPADGFPPGPLAGPFQPLGGRRLGGDAGRFPPPDRRDDPPANDALAPRVFDSQGRPVNANSRLGVWDEDSLRLSLSGKTLWKTIAVNGESLRLISRPTTAPPHGAAQAVYSLTDVDRARATIDRALLLLLPAIALLAGLGGRALTDGMLRRVDRLTQQANRIEENRLSERLTLPGDDEFARLAGAFNRMLDRLQTAFDRQRTLLDQQRRFTADASHELKTPLTVIKGNATVLLSDESLQPEQREAIEDMNVATGAMARLVQDLLLLARSDAGQLGRNGQAISLADVLARAAQLHRSRHAGIKTHLPPTDMIVMGNEDELVRLFSNLIDNAIRYTPPDGTIAIDFERREKSVTVSVADTGMGIAKQHLARLGERFYRVDSARSRTDGGSGLGLAICREIAKAHGGSLKIESEPGRGTTVRVTLPM